MEPPTINFPAPGLRYEYEHAQSGLLLAERYLANDGGMTGAEGARIATGIAQEWIALYAIESRKR